MSATPSTPPARRPAHQGFAFAHRAVEGCVVRLGYRLEQAPDAPDIAFEERFILPASLEAAARAHASHPAVARTLEALHLACGTSYWKAAAPGRIRLEGEPLPQAESDVWTRVYEAGLGEYFFKNGMSPRSCPRLPGGGPAREAVAPPLPRDASPLLLVGGGKDSAVSGEILRAGGVTPTLLSIGRAPWIERSAASLGGVHLVVERHVAPELLALNAAGALNGHVPISAILACIARLVALLAGSSAIIASNERSASFGNTVVDGVEINHQWSKGLEHERLVRAWELRNCPAGPRYFSLLRPLSELAIGRLFARQPRHFEHVTSCNRNFKLTPSPGTPRWCLACPKCVFVHLMLAPWLSDKDLARVFGGNPLEDPANLPLLEELAGLARMKPFECVGEPDEVVAALWLLHRDGRFSGSPALNFARERVLPALAASAGQAEALVARVLAPSPEHLVPEPYVGMLHAALDAR